jgi:NADH-quinone oxidoreductase subunit E
MLTELERTEIEQEIAHLPERQSACIDALRIVRKHRGWVSDEVIDDLAPVLGMSRAEVDSVATFYNLIFRKPVGKHVIMVCDSVSCWVCGEEKVLAYLESRLGIKLGETTPDGLITLLPTVCIGHCEQAPVMMVDEQVTGNLTEERIDRVISDLGLGI